MGLVIIRDWIQSEPDLQDLMQKRKAYLHHDYIESTFAGVNAASKLRTSQQQYQQF